MQKLLLGLAALVVFAVPAVTSPASARTVIIKHGHHGGWHHHGPKVVIMKHRH